MPNQPRTPIRTVRVGDSLWQAAREKAAGRGESLSGLIRDALQAYVDMPDVRPGDVLCPSWQTRAEEGSSTSGC